MHGRDDEASVNDELRQRRRSLVAVSSVHHQEAPKVAELSDGEVCCERRLSTFLPNNPHARVRLLNHAHVISAVSDGASLLFYRRKRKTACHISCFVDELVLKTSHTSVFLQEAHDLGLLRGRAAADDDRGALTGELHELVLVILEANLQCENTML